jgi:hypothetical protein
MSGWFVRNLRDVQWHEGACGASTVLEEGDRFPEIGLGIGMLVPGQPPCYYHRESHQEGYLVLSRECLLVASIARRASRTSSSGQATGRPSCSRSVAAPVRTRSSIPSSRRR